MSTDKAKVVRYIRDMSREMAKMANTASLDFLAYLLYIVVAEAQNLSVSEAPKILCKTRRALARSHLPERGDRGTTAEDPRGSSGMRLS